MHGKVGRDAYNRQRERVAKLRHSAPLPGGSAQGKGAKRDGTGVVVADNDEPLNVRTSLEVVRESLGGFAWHDGRPVLDSERRIRAEVLEIEDEMRHSIERHAAAANASAQAPAMSAKFWLMRRFKLRDHRGLGNISVPEFCEVWNEPVKWDDAAASRAASGLPQPSERLLMRRVKVQDPATGEWICGEIATDYKTGKEVVKRSPPGKEKLAFYTSVDERGNVHVGCTEAHAAAIFVKYGYDVDGYLPYDVFCNTLFTKPARLLGMEPIMNQKAKGRHGFGDHDDPEFDGKILYQKSINGVLPPSDFDPEMAHRSSKMPTATMRLEHVHGYSGLNSYANNIFYNTEGNIVYFTAMLGVVHNPNTNRQRFFYGHNDDVLCIAMHPNRKWVCTGQTKAVGPEEVPYICVWDSTTSEADDSVDMRQLQRIDHPYYTRGIIAAAFDPHDNGQRLVTVGSDNEHSMFLWRWMKTPKSAMNDKLVSGWSYGPEKKLSMLDASPTGFYWNAPYPPCSAAHAVSVGNPPPGGAAPGVYNPSMQKQVACCGWNEVEKKVERYGSATPSGAKMPRKDLDIESSLAEQEMKLASSARELDAHGGAAPPANLEAAKNAWKRGDDGSYQLLNGGNVMAGHKGAPPQIYGVVWNPYRRDEFVTYGMKHIKWWNVNAQTRMFEQAQGSFGPTQVDNVLSCTFMRDPIGLTFKDRESGAVLRFRQQITDPETGKVFNQGNAKVTHSGKVIAFVRDKNERTRVVGERYVGDMPGGANWFQQVTSTVVLTGFPNGRVGIWLRSQEPPFTPLLMRTVAAHERGPQIALPDGTMSFGGVRSLRLRSDEKTLLSAGADSRVHTWDVTQTVPDEPWMSAPGAERTVNDGQLGSTDASLVGHSTVALGRGAVKMRKIPGNEVLIKSPYKSEPSVRFAGLDCLPGSDVFVAGTTSCDVWQLGGGQRRVLVYGHMADLYGVCAHPRMPSIWATACESDRVFVWNAEKRDMTSTCQVGFIARACAFSQCGKHLAVGGKFGRLKILESMDAEGRCTLRPLESMKKCEYGIDEIRYSPNNRILATSGHDLTVDIYDTGFRSSNGKVVRYPNVNEQWDDNVWKAAGYPGGYQHLYKMRGHSATVCCIDFSLPLTAPPHLRGKTIIQSNCNGREILFWDPLTGKQITENQRDTSWSTWTSKLGFGVMGIWADGAGNDDVNSVCRSNSQEYVLTCDDFGGVRLFNFPCVADDAPYRLFRGHSSHVTNGVFSADDRYVFTAGGHDRAAFQWRTIGVNKDDTMQDSRELQRVYDVDQDTFAKRKELTRAPPPKWGALDAEGKYFGPLDGAK